MTDPRDLERQEIERQTDELIEQALDGESPEQPEAPAKPTFNQLPGIFREAAGDWATTHSRRALLLSGLAVGAGLALNVVDKTVLEPVVGTAEEVLTEMNFDYGVNEAWPEISVFPGIIIANPDTEFKTSIFQDGVSDKVEEGMNYILSRPILVRPSLIRAIKNEYMGWTGRRASSSSIDKISPGLVAFRIDQQKNYSFLDVNQQAARLNAISRGTSITEDEGPLGKSILSRQNVKVSRTISDGITTPMVERAHTVFAPTPWAQQRFDESVKHLIVDGQIDYSSGEYYRLLREFRSNPDHQKAVIQRKLIGRIAVTNNPRQLEAVLDTYLADPYYEIVG